MVSSPALLDWQDATLVRWESSATKLHQSPQLTVFLDPSAQAALRDNLFAPVAHTSTKQMQTAQFAPPQTIAGQTSSLINAQLASCVPRMNTQSNLTHQARNVQQGITVPEETTGRCTVHSKLRVSLLPQDKLMSAPVANPDTFVQSATTLLTNVPWATTVLQSATVCFTLKESMSAKLALGIHKLSSSISTTAMIAQQDSTVT